MRALVLWTLFFPLSAAAISAGALISGNYPCSNGTTRVEFTGLAALVCVQVNATDEQCAMFKAHGAAAGTHGAIYTFLDVAPVGYDEVAMLVSPIPETRDYYIVFSYRRGPVQVQDDRRNLICGPPKLS